MSDDLMSQQLATLQWSLQLLEAGADTVSADDFARLSKDYGKLLKDMQRILRISDRNEARLHRVSEDLSAEKQRLEQIAGQLSSYLPRQIYQSIFEGKQTSEVKSQRKLLTIFFSDIQGFTNISEALQPEQLTLLMNEYFSEMSAIALHYGGTIDKFIGDAIMIFFGDPDTQGPERDALLAVQMAVAMQQRLAELNIKWQKEGLRFPLITRMGINTGWCTVGNFGSRQRMSYTIIGGEVNLTARIEGACEPGGVLLSHETYAKVKHHVVAQERESIQLKGIARPVATYAVRDLIADPDATPNQLQIRLPGRGALDLALGDLTLPERLQLCAHLRDLANQLVSAHLRDLANQPEADEP